MLHLTDVLQLMEMRDQLSRPLPFSLKAFTSEGEPISYDNVTLCVSGQKTGPALTTVQNTENVTASDPKGIARNPNHYVNMTRNLKLPNGEVRKVKIWLIKKFNGQAVVW